MAGFSDQFCPCKANQISSLAHMISLAFFCGDRTDEDAGEYVWEQPKEDPAVEAFDEWRAKVIWEN